MTDVETMLLHIRDETPIHTFSPQPHPFHPPPPSSSSFAHSFAPSTALPPCAELVEEEVEIEVDEDEEWEEEDDAAPSQATPLPPPSPSSSPSLPTIRIDPSTTLPLTSPFPPPTSSLRPPSHLLTPSFSPNLLPPSSPSFSPAFAGAGEGAEDGRMREVADMVDVPSPLPPSPSAAGEEAGRRSAEVGMGGAEGRARGDGEEKVEAPVGVDRATELRAELADVERQLEEARALVEKQTNRIFKKKVTTERVVPLEEKRDRILAELNALAQPPA